MFGVRARQIERQLAISKETEEQTRALFIQIDKENKFTEGKLKKEYRDKLKSLLSSTLTSVDSFDGFKIYQLYNSLHGAIDFDGGR